jgi:hypothetical protein
VLECQALRAQDSLFQLILKKAATILHGVLTCPVPRAPHSEGQE